MINISRCEDFGDMECSAGGHKQVKFSLQQFYSSDIIFQRDTSLRTGAHYCKVFRIVIYTAHIEYVGGKGHPGYDCIEEALEVTRGI